MLIKSVVLDPQILTESLVEPVEKLKNFKKHRAMYLWISFPDFRLLHNYHKNPPANIKALLLARIKVLNPGIIIIEHGLSRFVYDELVDVFIHLGLNVRHRQH